MNQKRAYAYLMGCLLGSVPSVLFFALGFQHVASDLKPGDYYNGFFYGLNLFNMALDNVPPVVLSLCVLGQILLGIACLFFSRSRFIGAGMLTAVWVLLLFSSLWLSFV